MFLILLHYDKGLAPVERNLAAHAAYLKRYRDSGHFQIERSHHAPSDGEAILCAAKTREEAERIAAEDPLRIAGAARLEIVELMPCGTAQSLEELA